MGLSIVLVHKHYDERHLADVIDQMRVMGAPEIKAVYDECNGVWRALEGCHRIRAAKALGLVPVINAIDYDTHCDTDVTDPVLGLDLDMPGTTLAELVDRNHDIEILDF